MSNRLINPGTQHFTNDGSGPLSNGLMFFYEVGTTTPKDTYSDVDLLVPNSNPVILSAGGLEPDIFLDGTYRVILTAKYDSNGDPGVQQWDRDNVNVESSVFSEWVPTITYGSGGDNIVTGSDGLYYVSLATSNINHDPTTSAEWWAAIQFLQTWNANVSYGDDAMVELDGILYTSQQASNLNHNPSTDVGTWWVPMGASIADEQLFTSSGTWTKQAGVTFVLVELWGAGAGGGAGLNSAAAENRGGGGGGGGGAYTSKLYKASDLAATVSVTIGAGGAGGQTAAGSAGGTTSFGSHLLAYGGEGGAYGDNSGNVATGGQPGGSLTAGASLSGSTYGTADDTRFGAAGNSGGTNAVVALAGLRSLMGGPGGGGGGGLNAAGTATAGAAGGSQAQAASLTGGGGAGGAATGANGSAGAAFQGGGGGGAGSAGGVGGAGGRTGGGGGGGGGTTGAGSPPGGNGGAGGDGYAKISSW